MESQLPLPFRDPAENASDVTLALWSPRDIWKHLTLQLLGRLKEDGRVEHKRADYHLEELANYYSGFSNTSEGGVILLGIDKRGVLQGCGHLAVSKLNTLENFHVQYAPLARPELRRIPVEINGRLDFLIAIFLPYIGRLVETNKGKAFIRYGDTLHEMSDEEKRDFRASRHEGSFELEDSPLNWPSDFDASVIDEFCTQYAQAENIVGRSEEDILQINELGRFDGDRFVPNIALTILASTRTSQVIPGCRVRVQRFEGLEEGAGSVYSPIVDKFFAGNVVHIIKSVAQFIEDILYDFHWLGPEGNFITAKEYPTNAWFEGFVNACVHRSYTFSGTDITIKFFDDRLEIESPGGFVPPVTPKNIYLVRATRNHKLMQALYRLGWTRQAREGTRRMLESMRRWNLPEPRFEQEAIHGVIVRVTLWNNKDLRRRVLDKEIVSYFGLDVWRTLSQDEQKVAAYALANQRVNVSEAQRAIGRTWKTAKTVLSRLERKRILRFVKGRFSRDPLAHYELVEGGKNGD